MATCKECFHVEVCGSILKNSGFIVDGNNGCKEFKHKDDVAEVVRCKVCKSWKRNSGVASHSPTGVCFYRSETTLGVDYCSYGERRSQDGNDKN